MKLSPLYLLLVLALTGCGAAAGGKAALDAESQYARLDAERFPPDARKGLDPELEHPEFDQFDPAALTPQERSALSSEIGLKSELLDEQANAEVERYFVYFTHKARPTFERWLERARPYLPYVRQVLKENNLPEELIVLPFSESGYNNWAVSKAGAVGMWQFMPATAQRYGMRVDWWVDERRNPAKATKAACDYLSFLNGRFNDWFLALAAYNAGEGKITRALTQSGCDNFFDLARDKNALADETKRYVPQFLAVLKIFRNLEALGFQPVDWNAAPPETSETTLAAGTDLEALAQAAGLDWDDFQKLNPAFRRAFSPPSDGYPCALPAQKIRLAEVHLTRHAGAPFAGVDRCPVRRGDTWAKMAKRFDVPVEVLREINCDLDASLRPGDSVLLPFKGVSPSLLAAAPEKDKPKTEAVKPTDKAKAETAKPADKPVVADKAADKKGKDAKDPKDPKDAKDLKTADKGKTQPVDPKRDLAQKRANYIVQQGDTLYSIAKRYDADLETVLAANGMKTPAITVGQKLYIPDNGGARTKVAKAEAEQVRMKLISHNVQKGETVYAIARKYGVDPKQILALNRLTNADALQPGDTIKVQLP